MNSDFLEKDTNRMLKVGSVYPSRKRVSAMFTPEHVACRKTIGTALRESHNSHGHCKCSQERRDSTDSMPLPGRTQGTVTHPPSSETCKAGGHFKD